MADFNNRFPTIKIDLSDLGSFSSQKQAFLATKNFLDLAKYAGCNCQIKTIVTKRIEYISYEVEITGLKIEVELTPEPNEDDLPESKKDE